MAFILVHLLMGPVLILVGLLTKYFPPENINNFYGYRTARSMKSIEAWREANRYSSITMFRLGLITTLFQLTAISVVGIQISTLYAAPFMLAGIGVVIFSTERHLKQKGFGG